MLQAQGADMDAFSVLYERYNFSILAYLRRMLGSREDAESIGHEVFLRALRFAPTYRFPHKFSTWLFTIARNQAINTTRRRTRSPVRNVTELKLDGVEFDGHLQKMSQSAPDEVEKQEQIAKALAALEGLSAPQQEVIALGIFHDLTYAEMERILGAKAVTLRSRMFHGLRKLSCAMSVEGAEVESPAGNWQ
jgi:RNA polymerase sigma-70 factor (ECF subfamily)